MRALLAPPRRRRFRTASRAVRALRQHRSGPAKTGVVLMVSAGLATGFVGVLRGTKHWIPGFTRRMTLVRPCWPSQKIPTPGLARAVRAVVGHRRPVEQALGAGVAAGIHPVVVIDGFWNWYRTNNTGAAFSFPRRCRRLADLVLHRARVGGQLRLLVCAVAHPQQTGAMRRCPVRAGDRRASATSSTAAARPRGRFHPVALEGRYYYRRSTSPVRPSSAARR